MNWRKPIITGGLYLTGSRILQNLKEIESLSKLSQQEIKEYQEKKLEKLLLHAYQNVTYYTTILSEAGVIVDNKVNLENFNKIPYLTKDIIRQNFSELKSSDLDSRKWYINHTGGSTGQPLEFLQDDEYKDWNFANKMYYCLKAGKDLGESEMKIWGSERDIIEAKTSIEQKIQFFLYGRIFENSFNLSEEVMEKIIKDIKEKSPKLIWGYVNSLYIIAKYINSNNIQIPRANAVLSTSGTLTESVREEIKRAFSSKVINVYGSREMGDIAFEEEEGSGLSILQHSHYLEVIKNGSNSLGDIVITCLTNYSMPLIRYKIGDVSEGIIEESEETYAKNKNYNGYLRLKNVVGREMSIFKKRNGECVPPEFFIHIVGVVYNNGFINKFQVIQKSYDLILVKIVLEKNKDDLMLEKIRTAIKKIMDPNCEVRFEFMEDIEDCKSGKYLYTICEVDCE